MSLAALLLPILAGGVHVVVAAQHMTLPLINYDEVVKALDPSDEGYQICTVAASFVAGCIAELGGDEALSTANPLKMAACACCVGTTDVAPVYSTCSDYLSSEAPDLNTQISAYDYLYSICGGSPEVCRGQPDATATGEPPISSPTARSSRIQSSPSRSSPSPASSPSSGPEETSRVTAEGSTVESTRASATGGASRSASRIASGTATTSAITYDVACSQMIDIYQECTRATPAFSALPFGEQAYCYCCRTALDGYHVTWTDEIETYARTCRDWAATMGKGGDYETAYNVATMYATFCDHFSDVCTMPTTTSPFSPTATGETGSSTTGGTATGTVDQAATTTSNDAAPTARIGLAAGVLAVAGFVVMV
ncbi:hypothetical protein A9Z42_0088010 [Trichoderma parareesei]|uniref:HFB protein n=1 Tax=Trichoderma parareesei TaxID=858221 RepID=A0A2H3A5C5_TRIPA|nr:hypothetical protein A9Z42_0088010 [Trichoderma parareesei]